MTNLEHILTDESFADFRKKIIIMGLRNCAGIDKKTGQIAPCSDLRKPTGCPECLFDVSDAGCANDMMEWLNEEYQEPLPFPIGTVIEVNNYWDNLLVCYYNGVKDGIHVGVYNKRNVGTDKGFTINIDTARKVGE